MTDAEIIERLTQVRGIGPWTVEMLLIFRLGRPTFCRRPTTGAQRLRADLSTSLPRPVRWKPKTCPSPRFCSKGKALGAVPFRGQLDLWRACDLAGTQRPRVRSSLQ